MKIVVVVPFLDEERHLPATLEALAAQERRPDQVVLVDDGSSDGSGPLARAFAEQHPWAAVVTRPRRPPSRDRLAAAGVVDAFRSAVEHLDPDWDVVAKLDADICLNPATVGTIEAAFLEDDRLGLAGTHLSEAGPDGIVRRLPSRDEHVHGATKFYRRACWDDIAPIPAILGWDLIDEVTARMRGWRTASLDIPGGDPLHQRAMGAQDGRLRGFRRWGRVSFIIGEAPLHVVLYGLRRMGDQPRVVGGLSYLAGWAEAGLRGLPRADPDVRAHLRRDQHARIAARLRPRRTA